MDVHHLLQTGADDGEQNWIINPILVARAVSLFEENHALLDEGAGQMLEVDNLFWPTGTVKATSFKPLWFLAAFW